MRRLLPQQSVPSRFFSTLLGRRAKNGSEQTQPSPLLQRPFTNERDGWYAYWKANNQPWRTEPEIDMKRQEELAQRRTILPDPEIEHRIYPFEKMQLSRADLEWLLASHENGHGPIDWNDENQREREGLDLRGTDLRYLDLHKLPLSGICGGLTQDEKLNTTEERRDRAMVQLEEANLKGVHLEGARLSNARLQGAALYDAYLQNADLSGAHLERVDLRKAHLERTDLIEAHLEGTDLSYAYIGGATLSLASLNNATRLDRVILSSEKYGVASLVDVSWGDVNLTVVRWSEVKMLGDEYVARSKFSEVKVKERAAKLDEYEASVRANRQLAVALQGQGLNEDAARFAYRAQVLQKKVLWFQMLQQGVKLRQRLQALGAWLFSWFLFLLAGYGYKLWRSFLAYLFIISVFTGLYLLNSHFVTPHLRWDEALVLSMSSFHGRGFFPQDISLGDTYARLSVVEGFVGLFVEVILIATFTQRLFGK